MSPGFAGVAFGLVAFVAVPLIAFSARAQINAPSPVPNQNQLIQKLQDARQIAAQNENSWSQEPITSREFGQQEAQLTDLIQKLKRGEKVSPSEVDQALQPPDTPY
jgi:hypothetical protein